MLGHTKKHHTERYSSTNPERSRSKGSEQPIPWKDAAKELFGHASSPALNLRGLRNREGLSQTELGRAIGVEQSNLSKMERGERQIGVKVAKRLEKLFDIDYRLFL